MTGSGVQPDGSFVPEFEGQRAPFEKGNQVARTHGARSTYALSEQAEAMETVFRESFQTAVDEELFRTVVESAAQVRLGFAAMGRVGDDPEQRSQYASLSKETRSWVRTLMDVLDRVAATPQARSEIAARLARAGIELRLDDPERAELERLEALTEGTGDLLRIPDIRDRVRLRDLREKAAGRA